jgi:hypothetical protein
VGVPIRRASGGRSASVQAVEVSDFSGGLNLEAGQFNLAANESAELVDMDIVGRGGVRRRQAIRAMANDFAGAFDLCPRSVFTHEPSNGDRYIYVVAPRVVSGSNRLLWYSKNGAAFTSFNSTFGLASNAAVSTLTSPQQVVARTAVVADTVFGVWAWSGSIGGRPAPFTIAASGATPTLAVSAEAGRASVANSGWTELFDPEPGSVPSMPNGKCVESHYGYLWVANTIEDDLSSTSVRRPSRVRWSHPGVPDRWRQDDWIDVEVGKDADQITALVAFRDHLLVFKDRSVHAIYGDSPENFTVVNLSNQFGCVSQEAVVATPFGVYFFDRNSGVWAWNGSSFGWQFEKVNSLLRDATIPVDRRTDVHLGWVKNRLWVGVPWAGESTQRARTLVFDPSLPRGGAWTLYSLGVGPFASVRQLDDSVLEVAGCSGTRFLQRLEQPGDVDELAYDGGAPVATPIVGAFRTPWLTLTPGMLKQWKRPDVVATSAGEISLVVDAYFDWNGTQGESRKTFYVSRQEAAQDLYWAADSDPLTENNWDDGSWAANVERVLLARGSNIGRSMSLSLRFTTPNRSASEALPRWSVDAVVVKFRRKRVRG